MKSTQLPLQLELIDEDGSSDGMTALQRASSPVTYATKSATMTPTPVIPKLKLIPQTHF